MKKKFTLSIICLMSAAILAFGAMAFSAGADTKSLSEEEINAIVSTTTDTEKISSPFTDAVDLVRDSVVGINNYQTVSSNFGYGYGFGYYGGGRGQSSEELYGTGSGVVITKYGHVLTNYHVVEGATRVTVTCSKDNTEHPAEVVGFDSDKDIAILQV